MDLITNRSAFLPQPTNPPSTLPSFSASSHHCNNLNLLFLPAAHGNLRLQASSRRIFFIVKAVLADRPCAPPDPIESLQKQITLESASASQLIRPTLTHLNQSTDQNTQLTYILEGVDQNSQNETRRPSSKRKKKTIDNGMGRDDTELESRWVHRMWVGTGSAAMVGLMAKALEAAGGSREAMVGVIVATLGAYVVADLATGIYHWGIDNYGDAATPVFGSQIDAFQGHHKRPWTITKRQFANNIHALARPATFALAPFLILPSHAFVDSFLSVFLACVVYSQQFHSWAHAKQKDVPEVVRLLQGMGLLVPRKMHGAHHSPPYNVNYCIVSGLWNPLLDSIHFFDTLEKLIFSAYHVRPRSWAETSVEWLQDGFYFSDGTDLDDTSASQ